MNHERIRILLIEDNAADAEMIRQMLAEAEMAPILLESVDRLSAGLERCRKGGINLTLLDLSLPDSQGLDTLRRVRAQSPEVPVVVLTGYDDAMLAIEALQQGAQDYLVKCRLDTTSLLRSIRYAVERRRAEDDRRQSEQKYRRLVENLRDEYFFYIHEPDRGLVYVSPSITDVLGYSQEEFVTHYTEYLTDNPINDAAVHLRALSIQRKQPFSYEVEILHKDGTIRRLEARETPVCSSEGKLTAAEGIAHDITDRKRAEKALRESRERFRDLVETISDWIWGMDTNAVYTYASPKIKQLLGYEPDEIIGKTPFDLMPLDERERVSKIFQAVIAARKPFVAFENTRLHKDGRHVVIQTSGVPILDAKGNLVGYQGSDRDITEHKSLQAQLYQAQKMEAVGRLAGGVAHDFNNLLTGITGYTQLLLTEVGENSRISRDLTQIHELTDRAATLTRQLLAFGRRQALQTVVLNINVLVEGIFKMLRRIIGEDVNLKFVPDPNLGNVRADPGQIEQVVMNLAVNARDAMPKGGKLVMESSNATLDQEYANSHAGTKPGAYVMLAMTDTGGGMDEATRERIFEPFFTTKEAGKGTGLGLATVYGIIKQHGGNIWVYSEPGKGTTFRIYLPRVHADIQEVTAEAAEPPAPRGTETLLIVEDEEAVRRVVQRMLKQHGFTAIGAATAGEAEKVLAQRGGEVALLLTDIVMPGPSGPELYDRLSVAHPALKVLYMSGYSRNASIDEGLLKPGYAYIEKPFTLDALARKIREVLDK